MKSKRLESSLKRTEKALGRIRMFVNNTMPNPGNPDQPGQMVRRLAPFMAACSDLSKQVFKAYTVTWEKQYKRYLERHKPTKTKARAKRGK